MSSRLQAVKALVGGWPYQGSGGDNPGDALQPRNSAASTASYDNAHSNTSSAYTTAVDDLDGLPEYNIDTTEGWADDGSDAGSHHPEGSVAAEGESDDDSSLGSLADISELSDVKVEPGQRTEAPAWMKEVEENKRKQALQAQQAISARPSLPLEAPMLTKSSWEVRDAEERAAELARAQKETRQKRAALKGELEAAEFQRDEWKQLHDTHAADAQLPSAPREYGEAVSRVKELQHAWDDVAMRLKVALPRDDAAAPDAKEVEQLMQELEGLRKRSRVETNAGVEVQLAQFREATRAQLARQQEKEAKQRLLTPDGFKEVIAQHRAELDRILAASAAGYDAEDAELNKAVGKMRELLDAAVGKKDGIPEMTKALRKQQTRVRDAARAARDQKKGDNARRMREQRQRNANSSKPLAAELDARLKADEATRVADADAFAARVVEAARGLPAEGAEMVKFIDDALHGLKGRYNATSREAQQLQAALAASGPLRLASIRQAWYGLLMNLATQTRRPSVVNAVKQAAKARSTAPQAPRPQQQKAANPFLDADGKWIAARRSAKQAREERALFDRVMESLMSGKLPWNTLQDGLLTEAEAGGAAAHEYSWSWRALQGMTPPAGAPDGKAWRRAAREQILQGSVFGMLRELASKMATGGQTIADMFKLSLEEQAARFVQAIQGMEWTHIKSCLEDMKGFQNDIAEAVRSGGRGLAYGTRLLKRAMYSAATWMKLEADHARLDHMTAEDRQRLAAELENERAREEAALRAIRAAVQIDATAGGDEGPTALDAVLDGEEQGIDAGQSEPEPITAATAMAELAAALEAVSKSDGGNVEATVKVLQEAVGKASEVAKPPGLAILFNRAERMIDKLNSGSAINVVRSAREWLKAVMSQLVPAASASSASGRAAPLAAALPRTTLPPLTNRPAPQAESSANARPLGAEGPAAPAQPQADEQPSGTGEEASGADDAASKDESSQPNDGPSAMRKHPSEGLTERRMHRLTRSPPITSSAAADVPEPRQTDDKLTHESPDPSAADLSEADENQGEHQEEEGVLENQGEHQEEAGRDGTQTHPQDEPPTLGRSGQIGRNAEGAVSDVRLELAGEDGDDEAADHASVPQVKIELAPQPAVQPDELADEVAAINAELQEVDAEEDGAGTVSEALAKRASAVLQRTNRKVVSVNSGVVPADSLWARFKRAVESAARWVAEKGRVSATAVRTALQEARAAVKEYQARQQQKQRSAVKPASGDGPSLGARVAQGLRDMMPGRTAAREELQDLVATVEDYVLQKLRWQLGSNDKRSKIAAALKEAKAALQGSVEQAGAARLDSLRKALAAAVDALSPGTDVDLSQVEQDAQLVESRYNAFGWKTSDSWFGRPLQWLEAARGARASVLDKVKAWKGLQPALKKVQARERMLAKLANNTSVASVVAATSGTPLDRAKTMLDRFVKEAQAQDENGDAKDDVLAAATRLQRLIVKTNGKDSEAIRTTAGILCEKLRGMSASLQSNKTAAKFLGRLADDLQQVATAAPGAEAAKEDKVRAGGPDDRSNFMSRLTKYTRNTWNEMAARRAATKVAESAGASAAANKLLAVAANPDATSDKLTAAVLEVVRQFEADAGAQADLKSTLAQLRAAVASLQADVVALNKEEGSSGLSGRGRDQHDVTSNLLSAADTFGAPRRSGIYASASADAGAGLDLDAVERLASINMEVVQALAEHAAHNQPQAPPEPQPPAAVPAVPSHDLAVQTDEPPRQTFSAPSSEVSVMSTGVSTATATTTNTGTNAGLYAPPPAPPPQRATTTATTAAASPPPQCTSTAIAAMAGGASALFRHRFDVPVLAEATDDARRFAKSLGAVLDARFKPQLAAVARATMDGLDKSSSGLPKAGEKEKERIKRGARDLLKAAVGVQRAYGGLHADFATDGAFLARHRYITEWMQEIIPERKAHYAAHRLASDAKGGYDEYDAQVAFYHAEYLPAVAAVRDAVARFQEQITKAFQQAWNALYTKHVARIDDPADKEALDAAMQRTLKYMDVAQAKILSVYGTSSRTTRGALLMQIITDSKFVALYVLKLVQFAAFVGAAFVAERLFQEMYMKQVYANNAAPPSINVMLGILLAIFAGFMLFVTTVLVLLMYIFNSPSNDFIVNPRIIRAFLLDLGCFVALFGAAAAMVGRTVQVKRYFRYQTEGLRGIRAFKDMLLSLAGVMVALPYFSMF